MVENHWLEHKETFHVCTQKGTKDRAIKFAALKEIAAFLNTRDGILLIGVRDHEEFATYDVITGIENDDFDQDTDSYCTLISDLIAEHLGVTAAANVVINCEQISGKTVCQIEVSKNKEPVFFNYGKEKRQIFVRRNGSSAKLPDHEVNDFFRNFNAVQKEIPEL